MPDLVAYNWCGWFCSIHDYMPSWFERILLIALSTHFNLPLFVNFCDKASKFVIFVAKNPVRGQKIRKNGHKK